MHRPSPFLLIKFSILNSFWLDFHISFSKNVLAMSLRFRSIITYFHGTVFFIFLIPNTSWDQLGLWTFAKIFLYIDTLTWSSTFNSEPLSLCSTSYLTYIPESTWAGLILIALCCYICELFNRFYQYTHFLKLQPMLVNLVLQGWNKSCNKKFPFIECWISSMPLPQNHYFIDLLCNSLPWSIHVFLGLEPVLSDIFWNTSVTEIPFLFYNVTA